MNSDRQTNKRSKVNPIADWLTSLASTLANRGLELDPATLARLSMLEGQTLEIEMSPPTVTLWVTVVGGRMDILAQAPAEPQVRVRASTGAMLAAIAGTGSWQQNTGLSIDGDLALFAKFIELLRQFRPDFAAPAALLLGQKTADSLIGNLELAAAGLRSALDGVGSSIKAEVKHRYGSDDRAAELERERDELRQQVAALQARINELEQPP